ncbi:MAG: 1A family penicillin-binding protein [Parcubacteria group bacterium LiPW_15]|nr:MAG: 1A family penicillin-binding protein [Parcubacteria group bacterium LiPW_15]
MNKKRTFFRYLLIGAASVFGIAVLAVFILSRGLPSIEEIDSREISQSTKILDRTGAVLLYDLNSGVKRTVIQPDQVPQSIRDATVAIEDERFYEEPAFDWRGILRAFVVNLTKGSPSQGASTITQQLARNAFLTPEKTIIRKLKELLLAVRLDRHYSKDQILWYYLNEIPYGPTTYGIEAASQSYFNKPAKELTLAESAILAAIPRNPIYYDPGGSHIQDLLRRKDLVLKKMFDLKKISEADYKTATAQKIQFQPVARGIKAPHFVMAVQDYLIQKYGEDLVRKGGLKITTTLDWDLQQAAEKAVADGAARNEKLYGGKNAALVAQNATSGQVLAMVGSRDYFDLSVDGNFNVATQGLRQPGSSLKPFIYLESFIKGYSPDTVLLDTPTEFAANNPNCPLWPDYSLDNPACFHPENFDHIFRGPVNLRNALAQSINIPAVKMLYLAGLKDSLRLVNSFGLTTLDDPQRYGLSLVLGGGAVRLADLVEAYSVLADDGNKHPQSTILEIKDSSGKVLESWQESDNSVAPAQNIREINDILSDEAARSGLLQNSLGLTVFPGHEVAMKTGTSNDYRDAWTVGYTPSLVVGVWAGNNDNSPMKRQGSSILAAIPIWSSFMGEALKTQPQTPFPKPDPRVPEKPILRGEYIIQNQLHTILYYVDKNDPAGSAPISPSSDPQYINWETSILRWASTNLSAFSSFNQNATTTTLFVPGNQDPQVKILSPADGSFVGNSVEIHAALASGADITDVNVYLNQSLVYSMRPAPSKNNDFSWSFAPSNLSDQNLLEIETKDASGRSAKSGIIVYKQPAA